MLSAAKFGRYTVLFLLLGVVVLAVLNTNSAYAQAQQGTEVRAELCDTTGPAISVVSPQSDSITDTRSVVLSGVTQRTSQLDISINNVYSQSLAIDSSNTFSTELDLTEGTNTISLDAYYSCNQTSQTFSIVITYVPKAVPSNGSDSSTQIIKPGNTVPITISNPNFESSEEAGESIGDRIKDNLGFGLTKSGDRTIYDYVKPIQSWAVLTLSVLTAICVFLPTAQLMLIFDKVGFKRTVTHGHWIIRFIAIVLVFIFATIVQV